MISAAFASESRARLRCRAVAYPADRQLRVHARRYRLQARDPKGFRERPAYGCRPEAARETTQAQIADRLRCREYVGASVAQPTAFLIATGDPPACSPLQTAPNAGGSVMRMVAVA